MENQDKEEYLTPGMRSVCRISTHRSRFLNKILRAMSVPLSCPSSAISYVADCPDRKSAWDLSATQKNCSQFETSYNCTKSAYHCYRTTNLSTIEICAPVVLISAGYCPSFSLSESRVTEQVCNPRNSFSCSSNKSWSNTFWKYQGCYIKSGRHMIYVSDQTKNEMKPLLFSTILLSVTMVMMCFTILYLLFMIKKIKRTTTTLRAIEELHSKLNTDSENREHYTHDEQQSVNECTSSLELTSLKNENEVRIPFALKNIENSKSVINRLSPLLLHGCDYEEEFQSTTKKGRECDECVPLIHFATDEHLLKEKTNADPEETIRIYLIGQTGEGKSSTANTILGEEAFKKEMSSVQVTHRINSRQKNRFGSSIHVIDFPGCEDLLVLHFLKQLIDLNSSKQQVIVLVIRAKRMSYMDENFIIKFKNYFHDDIYKKLIVLFTGHDELVRHGKDLNQYLLSVPSVIRDIIQQCNRILSFNNSAPFHERERQAKELITMINETIIRNENKRQSF